MNTGVAAYVVRRAIASLVLIVSVSTAAFVLARLGPGDETSADRIAGVSPELIARKRERLGLDRPLVVQAAGYALGVLTLDLGESARFERPVSTLVAERAANTATLAFAALLLATLLGVPSGIYTGAYPQRWGAALVTLVSSAVLACPPLVAALGLLFLAVSTGWVSVAQDRLLIPALALGLPIAAALERLQSQATREAMSAPDLLAASARGIPPGRLVWRHAARQALRPVLGVYGIVIGSLFSGSIAVEIVTSWPGLGRLMIEAVQTGDVRLVSGCVFAGAVCLALGNLVADGLRGLVDPRVRELA